MSLALTFGMIDIEFKSGLGRMDDEVKGSHVGLD